MRSGDAARVEEVAWAKPLQSFRQAGTRHSEAAFAAAQNAVHGKMGRLGIPGRIDHDRSRMRIAVGVIQPLNPHRQAVFPVIILADDIAALRGRIRAVPVGELLHKASVALIGAAVGTVVGIFMGLVGVLFMPLVGAAVGEYWAQKDQQRAAKVALATWLGLMIGMVAKVVLSFVMVGIFLVALWI